ncbi:hypothetical protein KIN34_06340 [Cellulomonas sp. DKR-3]|uniref:Uncharacterized protein n=1 Tax=Cellulomonas fulva TaxID=2835530 RepID=A0ABS5TXM5_9CELL|nr:hypothetical protein [Cellulomonas fulva]MBT0993904.1 hypothetical protein [Cellulomonas fulva]
MTTTGRYDWLPDHQLHVVATLAHADHLIELAAETLRPVLRDGAVELHDRYEGGLCLATVKAVKPIPPAVSRYTADALTQLRAALEHVLFVEVERATGRDLTESEARAIEMPACTDADDFGKWLNDGRRKKLSALRDGTRLVKRIRELQPYNLRKQPDQHPLRLLVAHTNLAKHRAPLVAATRVGRVIPDSMPPGVEIPEPSGQPVRVGDVLAIAPAGVVLPMDIWPTISVRRPHTGEFPILLSEFELIADWVRTVAIPILVTGGSNVTHLPVELDTTAAWDDPRAVIAAGGHVTAPARFRRSIQVRIGREGLRDMLDVHPAKPDRDAIRRWVRSLSDDDVLARITAVTAGTSVEIMLRNKAVTDGWVDEVTALEGQAVESPVRPV